jgi:hypothetical protein
MPLDWTGQTWDTYELQAEIGRGRDALLYEAYDTAHDRTVVLHIWADLPVQEETFRARLEVRAASLTALDHPNITKVYDFGVVEEHGIFYYVLPFFGGHTLEQQLGEAWPLDEAVRVMSEVAQALDHAHRQGIVHGHLRPDHILLTDGGWPQVIFTEPTLVSDFWFYHAPEQLLGKGVCPATDLYVTGLLFYEMLLGEHPFPVQDRQELADVQRSVTPSLRRIRGDVPRSVDEVVAKVLDTDPSRRYASGGDLARALVSALPAERRESTGKHRVRTPPAGVVGSVGADGARFEALRAWAIKVGGVLWRVLRWLLGKLAAALVVLVLAMVVAIIGVTYLLGNALQERLADQVWQFGHWAEGGETYIRQVDLTDPLQEAVAWYAPGIFDALHAEFSAPDRIVFQGEMSSRALTLQIRIRAQEGVPHIKIERLNDVPLVIIGGMLSDNINTGLRRSWQAAPVGVTELVVADNGVIRVVLVPRSH